MLTIRREAEIFKQDGGWFHARWHFSFDRWLQIMGPADTEMINLDVPLEYEPVGVWAGRR